MNETKQKIINAALELFSTVPYGEVSILQITKTAGVSNGILYSYFKNKEELFLYLMEEVVKKIEVILSQVKGKTIEERLKSYIDYNIEFTDAEAKLIKIFREGQYRFPKYEKAITAAYLKTLEKVFDRKLDTYEAKYILSTIRFINISYNCRNLEYNTDFLVKALLNGFSEPADLSLEKIYEMDFYERILLNSHNIRHQLIKKGEQFFGEREYYDVKVKEITEKIDISVGSFYSFFKTKELFLIEIVEKLKKEILYLLEDNYREDLSVNELFIVYFYIFSEYFQKSKYKYKLIRDVEFLNFDIYIDFLNKIDDFFISTLSNSNFLPNEKRVISNMILGVIHYMGIEVFFQHKFKKPELFLKKMSIFMNLGTLKTHEN